MCGILHALVWMQWGGQRAWVGGGLERAARKERQWLLESCRRGAQ